MRALKYNRKVHGFIYTVFFCLSYKTEEKKLLLTEIHCQSLEVDLRESNSTLQGSKSQLVRSEGRSSHKHLKIVSPVGSSPTEI